MKKSMHFTLFVILFIGISHAYSFESKMDFETYIRACIYKPDASYMGQCNEMGVDYEKIDTTLYSENNDSISFSTNVIKSRAVIFKQFHHDFIINCNVCSAPTSVSDTFSAFTRFKKAFESSALHSAFTSTVVTRNNRNTSEPSVQNNGTSFSEDFKNFASGTIDFKDVFASLFDSGDQNIVLVKDSRGEPFALIEIKNGKYSLVADLTKTVKNSDGSTLFNANLSTSNTQPFVDIVYGGSLNIGTHCKIAFTRAENEQRLVSQVSCY